MKHEKLEEALETINGFKKLKYGWDSYDAEPVSEVSIEIAKDFIQNCPAVLDFCLPYADVNGGIMFEGEHKGQNIIIWIDDIFKDEDDE